MKNTSQPIIFFGNERLASGLKSTNTPILHGLIEHGYPVVAIVSHHSDGVSRSNRSLEVATVAKEHNIPVLLPKKPTDITQQLKGFGAQAGVLVAYGRIIPQAIIDIFPKGIINVHPSLLPKYRGPTPIESPIANGDTQTGVSIMQLSAGMDEGPVYAQATTPLTGKETKFDLYETLAAQSAELLFRTLPSILDGSLHPTPQNNTEATYCKLLEKSDAWLDLSQITASQAERLVRAYLGFPKTKLTFGAHTIIVTAAHVSSVQKTPLDFLCRDGAFLSVDELIAPSGRYMKQEAFLRGYAAA